MDDTAACNAGSTAQTATARSISHGFRDVEKRIQQASDSARARIRDATPVGIPSSSRLRELMYDMMLLAFKNRLHRVVTFVLGTTRQSLLQ